MKFSNLPFKAQLSLIPILAVIIFTIVALMQKYYIASFHEKINKNISTNIQSLKSINKFESELSIIFGKIHDLILHVDKNKDSSEEYVYTNGKPLIYKLHEQKKFLDEKILKELKDKIDPLIYKKIITEFDGYRFEAASAITMVTVDLDLAREKAATTAIYYNNLINSLEKSKEEYLENTESNINNTLNENLNNMKNINFILILTVLIIFYLGIKISKELSRKFSTILNTIMDLSKEKEDVVIPEFKNKELQDISKGLQTFKDNKNKIKKLHEETLFAQKQLHKSEKMAAMGEMIGNIAHQWRQPLSIISTSASGMKYYQEMDILKKDDVISNCNIIEDNVKYLSQTIDDFRNYIKGDRNKKHFSLNKGIEKTISLIETTIKKNSINILVDIKDEIEINGYENELSQCLINIINNSKDAYLENNIEDRYLFLSAYKTENDVHILIKDSAGGIPEEIKDRIFDPYFTTKHQAQGTGLGLHMTHQIIIEGMEGKIEVSNESYQYESRSLIGAKFHLIIPAN